MLAASGFDVRLDIVGRKGDGYDSFVAFVEQLAGAHCIHFNGHVSESRKIELMQNADLFLSPTLYEGFGLAIAEAMACGCIVVTSKMGAVIEVAGPCAVYVDGSSYLDIYEAIRNLLASQSSNRLLSESATSRISELFSIDSHTQNLAKVVVSVFV
jgi:glycosyltransferase involved in cell wall biosynthesis